MRQKSYKDTIISILQEHKSGIHVNKITDECKGHYPSISREKLLTAINQTLANDVKRKSKAVFTKIPNKLGGFKRGYYKLKRTRRTPERTIASKITKLLIHFAHVVLNHSFVYAKDRGLPEELPRVPFKVQV